MVEKSKSFPDIVISSLSGSPANKKKPWQLRFASRETAKNSVKLTKILQESFDGSDISVSLLPGRNINSRRVTNRLKANEIRVSSIDVPDVVPFRQLVESIKESFKKKDGRLSTHLGWYISNTGSEKQQQRKVKKALRSTGAEVVKANASFWREGNKTQGKQLEALLEKHASKSDKGILSLAVEIDTECQSPIEFLKFIKTKRQEFIDRNSSVSLLLDIDLGHIAQWGIDPIEYLEEVIDDPKLKDAIAIVSFNQHKRGEAEAHAPLDDHHGVVDLENAAHVLGNKGYDQVVVFEPNPRQRAAFVQTIKGDFSRKVKAAFRNGRDKTL